ncbi:MAG: MFS transporter [Myxococcota bacterium]
MSRRRELGDAPAVAADPLPLDEEQGREGIFASLRLRDYRLLWLGQSCHAAALWMEHIARPWLVLLLTADDPVHLGGVLATQMLPQLLVGPWAGVVADWFDRRSIIVKTKRVALALNLVFAVLLLGGMVDLRAVYAFAFLRGAVMAFDQPARQSLIAALVPRELLTNAVALMSSTQNVMRILGVTLGGTAIALIGVPGAWVVITVLMVGAVITTTRIQPLTETAPGNQGGLRGMSRDLLAGARFAAARPEIRGVLVLSLVFFSFGMAYMQVFMPLFARFELNIGAPGLSLLSGSAAVGALSGALVVAGRRPRRLGAILPLVCAWLGLSLTCFALSWSAPRPYALVLAIFSIMMVGLAQTSYFSLSMSALLAASPVEMRGRVISLLSLDRAVSALGTSAAGFAAAALGTQAAQILYGVICIVAGLLVLGMAPGFRAFTIAAPDPSGSGAG